MTDQKNDISRRTLLHTGIQSACVLGVGGISVYLGANAEAQTGLSILGNRRC